VYLFAVLMPIKCAKFIEDHYAHLDLSKNIDSSTKTFKVSKDSFIVREGLNLASVIG